ncbi:DNA-binding protein [Bifidobacterium sp. DSM 109959]|uniref:DNA-binding protein n=2 Tax=Bifidobacterium olomucense TaxID=2675324 RepID=A0A7Y0EZ75_9BIFI|nr:DNA-binding protein [Bifidobacterium sp. DSM 109959]
MKRLFKKQGLSQDEVSLETGIPITSLSRKLNSGIFKYEEMCSIANLLKMPLSRLIELAEWLQEGKSFDAYLAAEEQLLDNQKHPQ